MPVLVRCEITTFVNANNDDLKLLGTEGFPWDVLAGSPDYEGLGCSRLSTDITKPRLRLFQSMTVSSFASENDLGCAMSHTAQRWCGASTPVKMLHTDRHCSAPPRVGARAASSSAGAIEPPRTVRPGLGLAVWFFV